MCVIYRNILNLRLLQSLPPTYFKVPTGGLVDQILKNETGFGGSDMTYLIQSHQTISTERGISWQEEAECLTQTIRVGQIDTMTVGCMFSEIVLYISLVIILAIILIKFAMAVLFGWFLSWRLGSFKEGSSYAARMRRDEQIEDWSRNINDNGPVTAIPRSPTKTSPPKRRTIFPTTSRFTPLEHGSTRFDSDRAPTPVWKK
jgi:chitin synthase